MGVTAAVIGLGSAAYSADQADDARKDEQARLAEIEKQNKIEEAEAARVKAESTPFRDTNAAKRIGLERAHLRRTTGKGRSGTVIRRSTTLG